MPTPFDLLHQEAVEAQLQRAIASGRLGQTLLFAGPTGVGKFRAALALAKTMLCDQPIIAPDNGTLPALPPEFALRRFCGACPSCRAVDVGSHPDVHVVTRELIRIYDRGGISKGTTLSIDVIRAEITGSNAPGQEMEAKMSKRPVRGPGKWFIIDDADLMETEGQNALLKTLEEPPPNAYLILITTQPGALLPTIRSRSQTYFFQAMSPGHIAEQLTKRGMPKPEADRLANLSDGSLGVALRWFEDIQWIQERANNASAKRSKSDDDDGVSDYTPGGILAWTQALNDAADTLLAGKGGAGAMAEKLNAFSAEYARLALRRDRLASKDRAQRDGLMLLLRIVADHIASRMAQLVAKPRDGKSASADRARRFAGMIQQARESERQIDSNAHVGIALAALTTRWDLAARHA